MAYGKHINIGLEIHQQLNTSNKLFCSCPILKSENFPFSTTRRIRAVAGEGGKIDPAALYEMTRGREFIYRSDNISSCLIELDEEPPKQINEDALYITLQVCKLLSSSSVEEVHVMRKTVADGSAVSGFQRTALVGVGGQVKTSFGKIGIQTVCLEEDSSVDMHTGRPEYRIDRLGVPLVEIATAPDMHSPEETMAAAEKIGTLLRSLNVRRGIGSIRQDINVSIEGGERIEIKGFQELDRIAEAVNNEVLRQVALLEVRDELRKRGVRDAPEKVIDVTHVFRNTESFVRKSLADGKVLASVLHGFGGLMKKELGDRTLGKELSGYAAAYGYGITHSDEDMEKYKLTEEFMELRKLLNAGQRDIVFIVAGKGPEKGITAVIERARYCLIGIPKETRVADGAGSRYTRPLPGSERMYPETDVPVHTISGIKVSVPKTIEERTAELKKLMPEDMANQLARSEKYYLYENLTKKFNVDAVLVATTLLSTVKDLKRRGLDVDKISEDELEKVFAYAASGRMPKSAVPTALEGIASGKTAEEIIQSLEPVNEKKLRSIVNEAVDANAGQKESVIMGIVMAKVRGRADGSMVAKLLREAMRK
ncbi:MAG: Glu-tRNA(Gln) amidotransferase subunit GatE [Candidatus Aenigmarchaeota archaeon]|nr:Glu-tRNA(Gln) amidotransferase subunit GatE [Candidatus Aenigmarchaeota archaeon]